MFEPDRRTETGDGEVFAAVQGDGRLLVGAFENADGHTAASYMSYIRRESYSGYDIDYAPRGQTWFVLSGENDQNVLHEKVMFSVSVSPRLRLISLDACWLRRRRFASPVAPSSTAASRGGG